MKTGLVLAGGGIKGIAHAGVLQALEENGINIDIIGGTSSGSLVSVLYAVGYKPKEILDIFKKHSKDIIGINKKYILKAIHGIIMKRKLEIDGLNTGDKFEKLFEKLLENKNCKNMQDIKKVVIAIPSLDLMKSQKCVFTNYEEYQKSNIKLLGEEKNLCKKTKETIYINNIEIFKAVRASSSFPGVFIPFKYKKYMFIDGGAIDNVPVDEILKCGADKIITVNFKEDNLTEKCNAIEVAGKTIDVMCDIMNEKNLSDSDIIIGVNTNNTGLLDIKKIDYCYMAGYIAGIRKIKEIKGKLTEKKDGNMQKKA